VRCARRAIATTGARCRCAAVGLLGVCVGIRHATLFFSLDAERNRSRTAAKSRAVTPSRRGREVACTEPREGRTVLTRARTEANRRLKRRVRQTIAMLGAAAIAAVVAGGRADAAPPIGTQLDPTQMTGCCVCRGTAGGEQQSIRSCADGFTIDGCMAKCHGEGGASVAFGYQQTCSQGCGGFPTQTQH
jgi:hypothetical protein